MSSDICHFCGSGPAIVTLTRSTPGIPPMLRLCERCADIHQVTTLAPMLEGLPVKPCLLCGRGSELTAQSGDKRWVVALCRACAQRSQSYLSDVLRVCTLWTPGVLKAPPPMIRLVPPPPGSGRMSVN